MALASPLDPPNLARTLHCIGDVHMPTSGPSARHAKTQADINSTRPAMPTPAARLMLGDLVNDGLASEDAYYLAWVAGMNQDAPIYRILGNHDILNDVRTPDQAAAALGLPAANYTVDLGFALLVCLFPADSWTVRFGSQMTPDRLAWLDATIAAADKDVIVACHFAIYNTVLGDVASQWRSIDTSMFVADTTTTANSNGVLAVLAAHAGKVKLWIAAHTHSNIDSPGMFSTVIVGGQRMAVVNASTIIGTDKAANRHTRLNTLWLSYFGTDTTRPRIDLRWRDHGNSLWTAATDQPRTQTVSLV